MVIPAGGARASRRVGPVLFGTVGGLPGGGGGWLAGGPMGPGTSCPPALLCLLPNSWAVPGHPTRATRPGPWAGSPLTGPPQVYVLEAAPLMSSCSGWVSSSGCVLFTASLAQVEPSTLPQGSLQAPLLSAASDT